MKNIPNYLCLLRIILVLPIAYLSLDYNPTALYAAMALFVIASFTDFLDGYLARKYNIISNLGKLLDPLADKMLVLSIYIVFLMRREIHLLFVLTILLREFAITGMRAIVASEGVVVAASKTGKLKTVSQMLFIVILYLQTVGIISDASYIIITCEIIVGFLTLYSGGEYLYQAREFLRN